MPRRTQRARGSDNAPRVRAVISTEPIVSAAVLPWEIELLRPLFQAVAGPGEVRHGH